MSELGRMRSLVDILISRLLKNYYRKECGVVMSEVVEVRGLYEIASGYSTLNNALEMIDELSGIAGLEVEPIMKELVKASVDDPAVRSIEELLLMKERNGVPLGCHGIQASFVAVAAVRGIEAAVRHLNVLVDGYDEDERVRALVEWELEKVNRTSEYCVEMIPFLKAIGCRPVGERVVPEVVEEDEAPAEYVNPKFDD